MPWSLDSERTVYLQLMDHIKQRILSGEYKPGDKMPSVRELAMDAEVNPNTMQRALSELERLGFLYTQRTNGRYVTEDAELIAAARRELAEAETRRYLDKLGSYGLDQAEIIPLIQQYLN